MIIRYIYDVLFLPLLLCFLALKPAAAQDMLASASSSDHAIKAIDTLALQRLLDHEDEVAADNYELYDEWSNAYPYKATTLPETYKIDLRGFCMPTSSRAITSNFGYRWGRQHKGIDIKVYTGDTIRAAFAGKVRVVKYDAGGYGYYVVIRHQNGLETIYGHLSRQLVKENQIVKAGDVIGLGGNTGRSTGSHLHFETRICGVAINPALMFDFREQDVVGDYYEFNRRTYEREGLQANRIRGMKGNGSYTEEEVRGTSTGASSKSYGNASRNRKSTAKKQKSQARYHKVKKGETLSSIARRQGTTVAKLCKLNKISTKTKLRIGQVLRCS